jgi:tetratricopeptide (TPR) repeat protein
MRAQVAVVLTVAVIVTAMAVAMKVNVLQAVGCIGPLTLLVLGLMLVARQRPVLTRLALGVRLLNRGRYSEALTHFEAERQAVPNDPLVLFDVGVTRLQLWQLDRARAALEDAWSLRARAAGHARTLNTLVPEHLALICALRNEPTASLEWQRTVPPDDADPARAALANAILAAHAGEWATARTLLSSFEVKQLGGVFGGLVRAVDAMCIERLTGEQRPLDRVALYGETGPEELRKVWKDLVEFVDRSPPW